MILVIYDSETTAEQVAELEAKSVASGWVIVESDGEWPTNRDREIAG